MPVRLTLSTDAIEEQVAQLPGDWTNLAVSNDAAIDFHDGREVGCSARHEHFVRDVELAAIDFALNELNTQLALREFDDALRSDAFKYVVGGRGRSACRCGP